MTHSTKTRADARRMREEGSSYRDIAATLHLSLSTVSLWCRDQPKPPRDMAKGEAARLAGHRAYYERRRLAVDEERLTAKMAAADEIGGISRRELMLVGAALYWAEGSKAKPWRTGDEAVRFTNSDPVMIRLFLAFLTEMGIAESRLRFAVQIHESADVVAAEAFWRETVGGDSTRFGKTSLKRHNPKTTRMNTGEGYHGCLRVAVLGSAGLYRAIEGIWWAVSSQPTASLGPPSRVV